MTIHGWTFSDEATAIIMDNRYELSKTAHYNEAPPNFLQVTEREFARDHDHTAYVLAASSHRQITRLFDGTKTPHMIRVHLFLNTLGYGWGLERDYHVGVVRYYFFALCMHDWKITSSARCYAEYACSKCRETKSIDSSD